jgi:hypothetical protein
MALRAQEVAASLRKDPDGVAAAVKWLEKYAASPQHPRNHGSRQPTTDDGLVAWLPDDSVLSLDPQYHNKMFGIHAQHSLHHEECGLGNAIRCKSAWSARRASRSSTADTTVESAAAFSAASA